LFFFFLQPKRIYYLEDPEGYALEWCETIDQLHQHTNTYILAQLLNSSSALSALHQIREIVLMLLITIVLRMKQALQNQISSS
jgi:PH domain